VRLSRPGAGGQENRQHSDCENHGERWSPSRSRRHTSVQQLPSMPEPMTQVEPTRARRTNGGSGTTGDHVLTANGTRPLRLSM
jgi:hypothetical protein